MGCCRWGRCGGSGRVVFFRKRRPPTRPPALWAETPRSNSSVLDLWHFARAIGLVGVAPKSRRGSPGGCLSVQLLSRCWLAQTYLFNSKLAEQIILFLPSSRQRTRPVWKSISACTVEVFHAARQDPHTAGVRGYEDRVTRVGSVSKLKLCRTGCQLGVFVPLNVQFDI